MTWTKFCSGLRCFVLGDETRGVPYCERRNGMGVRVPRVLKVIYEKLPWVDAQEEYSVFVF
jgi:hypothetical protein